MEVKSGTHVYLLENVISSEFCETIKYIIDNTDGNIEEYGPGSNVQGKTISTKDIKNTQLSELLDNELYKIVSNIITIINNLKPYTVPINMDSGYQLRKIHGPTRIHIDDIFTNYDKVIDSKSLRKLSLVIALNEDYEGGEFCFPEQGIEIKLKRGQAILFPPYWTHPHYTNKLDNDTFRYTINTWLLN
jgi:hypothetical protein